MNKDNKRRKMAIGAVVAAGVTTGAMAATPTPQGASQDVSPEVQLTAADQVVIDGENLDFDKMIAQLPPQVRNDRVRLMYGVKPVYGPRTRERLEPVQPSDSQAVDTAAVADSIISIIARRAGVAAEDVHPQMLLRKDLGMKRVDIDRVAIEVARQFNIVIPYRKIRSFRKVEDIINCVTAVL